MIASDALGARVENRFAVDEEAIVVMAVNQRNLDKPCAVRLAFHGVGNRIPIIEIAHQMHVFGFGSNANKINRLGHFFGRITVLCKKRTSTHYKNSVQYT